MSETREALKPCPFCGAHAERRAGTTYRVECAGDNCPVNPTAYGVTEDEAVTGWNSRALSARDERAEEREPT